MYKMALYKGFAMDCIGLYTRHGQGGCDSQYQLGNVLSEIARIVPTQTARLIGISTPCTVFIASH